MQRLDYKQSGVDIIRADSFKARIKSIVRGSFGKGAFRDIGGFGSFFSFPRAGFKNAVLVSSADGVGTKLKIAALTGRHDTIGIDAVAMNVNDILCVGARPLFFLDYIAFSRLKAGVLEDVVRGLTRGCIEAGCALIGGETAQMPGMYKPGDYDLAGFCVGAVEREKIIDGAKIKAGDAVIGLESSGIHSNGYALARKVFAERELKRMSKELLKPTRIYVKPVLSLLKVKGQGSRVKGIAHITGGAFYDKIARILPENVSARIAQGSWPVPRIFGLIQKKGNIADREMFHTFNMGIGMVLFSRPQGAEKIIRHLAGQGLKSWVIGEAIEGSKKVEIRGLGD